MHCQSIPEKQHLPFHNTKLLLVLIVNALGL